MNWADYQFASNCTSGPSQGAKHLLAWLLDEYGSARSMGIYNCRNVRGGSTTSLHGEGRAVDLGVPVGRDGKGTPFGHSIVNRLGSSGRRLGLQAVIYDREIWSKKSPSGRYYGGVHPHYDHLHIELTWAAARNLTYATLRAVLGSGSAQEDDIMIDKNTDLPNPSAAVQRHQQALRKWKSAALPQFGADGDYGDETEEWVRNYQKAADLPVTGRIDGVTSALLLRHLDVSGNTDGVSVTKHNELRAAFNSHRHNEGQTGKPNVQV